MECDQSPVDRSLIAHLATTLEESGLPRPLARAYAALMLAKGEGLSTSELRACLDLSKASVSSAVRTLRDFQLIERYSVPESRETHYRVMSGKWGDILARKYSGITMVRKAVEESLALSPSEAARERLAELCDVYSFWEKELTGVTARWDARAEAKC